MSAHLPCGLPAGSDDRPRQWLEPVLIKIESMDLVLVNPRLLTWKVQEEWDHIPYLKHQWSTAYDFGPAWVRQWLEIAMAMPPVPKCLLRKGERAHGVELHLACRPPDPPSEIVIACPLMIQTADDPLSMLSLISSSAPGQPMVFTMTHVAKGA